MEEEIDFLAENSTINTYWNRPTFLIVYDVLLPAFCILGILGEIAIIYLVTRWHHLRSVTNIILAHWSFIDLLFVLLSCVLYHIIVSYPFFGIKHLALLAVLERLLLTTLNFGQILWIYLLLMNSLLNSTKFRISVIVLAIYIIIALYFCIVLMIYLERLSIFIIQGFNKGFSILVILTVIYRAIESKIKRDTTQTNKNNEIRFKIVCIYTLLWIASLVFVIVGIEFQSLSYLFVLGHLQHLTSLCIILYLKSVDPNFKLCLRKIFRRNAQQDERVIFQVNQLVEEQV